MTEGLNSENGTGSKGEKRCASILSDKYISCDKKDGDGYFCVENDQFLYEVKTTELDKNSDAKLNQVRPIKCITLIIYFKNENLWSVIDPIKIFELTQSKTRGQHNECVIECTQIEVNKLPEESFCKEDQLYQKLKDISKIYNTKKYKLIRYQCQIYLDKLKSFNEESRQTLIQMVNSEL